MDKLPPKQEKDLLQRFDTTLKVIGSIFFISIALLGALFSYLNQTTVSAKEFLEYKNENSEFLRNFQKEFLKESTSVIEKSISPIILKIAELDNKVINTNMRVSELTSVLNSSDLIKSKEYNDFQKEYIAQIQKILSSIERLNKEVDSFSKYAVGQEERYYALKNDVKILEQELRKKILSF
jgi:hypothetical protein